MTKNEEWNSARNSNSKGRHIHKLMVLLDIQHYYKEYTVASFKSSDSSSGSSTDSCVVHDEKKKVASYYNQYYYHLQVHNTTTSVHDNKQSHST